MSIDEINVIAKELKATAAIFDLNPKFIPSIFDIPCSIFDIYLKKSSPFYLQISNSLIL